MFGNLYAFFLRSELDNEEETSPSRSRPFSPKLSHQSLNIISDTFVGSYSFVPPIQQEKFCKFTEFALSLDHQLPGVPRRKKRKRGEKREETSCQFPDIPKAGVSLENVAEKRDCVSDGKGHKTSVPYNSSSLKRKSVTTGISSPRHRRPLLSPRLRRSNDRTAAFHQSKRSKHPNGRRKKSRNFYFRGSTV